MSKTAVRKLHWRSKVLDTFVPLLDASGEPGVAIGGGADYGEFPFVISAPAGGLTVGDIILEIGGTPVLGMTLGDVRGVLNSCPHPIRAKTVSPGSTLCKDLRLFLSKCFTPGSVDSQLQQVIRENLYLRAVPCTTRQRREGEIAGVDYNFVTIEEFFSLEELGALLESGKFNGNYYGTPRPVHISAESHPITYQEHRNLLRNFPTRSKSLSNLEKAAEDAENSEEDSGLSGGSAGVGSSIPTSRRSPGRPRASSQGDGPVAENGILGGGGGGGGVRGAMPDHWEQAFSDTGESHYIDRNHKRTYWRSRRGSTRETACRNEWFTDQPGELRGFPVHTHLTKGSRGFGFNIVGGSRPREFLQVYSVTASGPSVLKTADILVYINDVCVLGVSHREVVEMLKSVPVGHDVDVEVRRGYPMLYNPDGCPKQDPSRPAPPPTTAQPLPLHQLPRLPTPTLHFDYDGLRGDGSYMEPGVTLDANGNAVSFAARQSPSFRRSSVTTSATASPSPVRPPRSLRSLARLQSLDPTLASQSDSEVVSAIGSHRASMIRNHNNNSLSTPPHPYRYSTFKSSESDVSTLSGSRLPLPQAPRRPFSSPGGPHSAPSRLLRPHSAHLRPPPTPDSPRHYHCFNSFHANTSPTASPSSVSSPGGASVCSGAGGLSGGELVPVALAQTEGDQGLGFSVTAGGQGGRMTVVNRVWDRKQCSSLQPGDAIVKINGADVQSLTFGQVQTILQEHAKQAEVILLIYRGGIYHSNISPGSNRRLPPPLLHPPPPPVGSDISAGLPEALLFPRAFVSSPPSPAPKRSSLIQSTSFLESIPVTLTMEPNDWISAGPEDEAGGVPGPDPGAARRGGRGGQTRPLRGFDVELRRKPGEGFGFVVASEDVANGRAASLLPHRFGTVRRGSPAAKSGQIRPGDRLEAVEGRPVVTLPHRELTKILRRAGNTLRLTIIPRPSTYSSSLSEPTELDSSHRSRKGQRSRPKKDSRYYSVDLDRGPSGFGFSLRGGSEYNMGLYVLGLMEGGPASRSTKMQVSDQLVEIGGDSTAGMTHSQAVEQIRRGGQRIHLVLKRGNGYVPDYGREHRVTCPSPPRNPEEQGLAAVDSTGRKGHSSKKRKTKRRSRSSGELEKERWLGRGRRGGISEEGGHSGSRNPFSLLGERSQGTADRRRHRGRKAGSQSLPRDALRHREDGDADRGTSRGRKHERRGTSSKSRQRTSQSEERSRKTEGEEPEEEEQRVRAVEERVEEVEERVSFEFSSGDDSEDDVFLPIPIPNQMIPRPKQKWEAEWEEEGGVVAEYKESWKETEQETEQETMWPGNRGYGKETEPDEDQGDDALSWPLPSAAAVDPASHRRPFSFLTSTLSLEPLGGNDDDDDDDGESESGGSQSDGGSASAASISGLSLAATGAGGRWAAALPGPWLTPSQQRAGPFPEGDRRPERRTGQRGGGGAIS